MPGAVSDSSTLIHLSLLGRLSLLRTFYDEILIPSAVWREVVEEGRGRPGAMEVRRAVEERWIRVVSVADENLLHSLRRELDDGESEAVALAMEQEFPQILVDESHARRVAAGFGLEHTGVVGILIRGKTEGFFESLRPELDRLRSEGTFWISDTLYQKALDAVGE